VPAHHRPLRFEALEQRQLLAVTLAWTGPGNALNLTEGTSGTTPAITISEPTPGVSLLKIDLGAGQVFASGSTASATGLIYQNAASPTTSEYATIDISATNNITSLVATLPGDGLTLGQIRDLNAGVATITVSAGTIAVAGVNTFNANGNVSLSATGNLTVNASATINTGTGTLSLAADTTAAGAGYNGTGTLVVQANSTINASSITLRGAAMSIDPTAAVGSAIQVGGVVSTLAGTSGLYGSSNGTGSAARFNSPSGVAVDSAGDVYVADENNDAIRKITPAGVVTTLAGLPGISGSYNGTGSTATFDLPDSVAVDSAGNAYVADTYNQEIRKITPAGVVTTLAGYPGSIGSTNGTGSAARFYYPTGVAVDSTGNVYVADDNNDEIRKITPAGVVTTLAGSPEQAGSNNGTGSTARFYFPNGVAVDSAGNVYVTDADNDDIREITPAGVVTTLAGFPGLAGSTNGTGNAARFSHPSRVALDSAGNLYVGDAGNDEIREITPAGVVTTLAGAAGQTGSSNGTGSAARFYYPDGVAVDSAGNIYVGDQDNDDVRVITPVTAAATSQVTIRASLPSLPMSLGGGSNDVAGINLTAAELACIQTTAAGGVTIGDDTQTGNIAVKTASVATTTGASVEIATTGTVTLDAAGVFGAAGNRIQFDATATPASIIVGSVTQPGGAYLEGLGNLSLGSVTSFTSGGLLDVTALGNLTVLAGATLSTGSGTLSLAADTQANGTGYDGVGTLTIQANTTLSAGSITLRGATMSIDPSATIGNLVSAGGVVTTLAGYPGQMGSNNGAGSAARFAFPASVAVDSAGNVYVADGENDEIRAITPAGVVSTLAGSPGQAGSSNGTGSAARFNFRSPVDGVAVDSTGNVYVADAGNDEIREITPAGVVSTLAGSADQPGSSNGTGTAAEFADPTGVAVDSAGNVYVADTANQEIRKISPTGVVTTLAGYAGQLGSTNGTGSAARFYDPDGVAVDSAGNVYVADFGNEEIRKITPSGVVTSLAQLQGLQAAEPLGVAVDNVGNVYVTGNAIVDGIIYKISPAGVATPLAAGFYDPSGVAVDSAGNVYVADTDDQEIRAITPITAVATSQVTIRSSLPSRPMSIGGGNNDVAGIDLTDVELACIETTASGTITIGDSTQTGNITFKTTTVANTAGAATAAVQATAGAGQIILDDQGSGPALNGNGGNVSLTAGTGGIAAASANNTFAEITTTGSVTLNTTGPIGSATNRIQFDATATPESITIGSTAQPAGTYLDGLGNLNLDNATSLANTGPLDVTARGNLTVVAGATVDTGLNTLSLAADTQANGTGDDGVGTLIIQAGATLFADSISLRGAGMSIDPTATVEGPVSVGAATTLAGSAGQLGSTNGTGTAARFEIPSSVAVDSTGNVYVADSGNGEIREISPSGVVTTLAGSPGQWGSSNGTGSAASFDDPSGVAVDSTGNVYVADTGNEEIRKISPSGVVTTLAGSPGQWGSNDGTGSAASFEQPTGVAVDSAGNVYVADSDNNEIRKISPSGVVTTLAGSAGQIGSSNGTGSAARFEQPTGVAVDSAGNVYVADSNNWEIRKISPSGVVTTLAGSAGQWGSRDGTGSAAQFFVPFGVAVDNAGNVYVADQWNQEIREITPLGVVTTLAGVTGQTGSINGTGNAARFDFPFGVAVDSAGNVYVADQYNEEIRKLAPLPVSSQVTIRSSLPSLPMSIGGGNGDVAGINLTDAELACIQTLPTGTITIGDSTQTGNVTFTTATPATTAGASTVVIQATGGTGQIILNDGGGSGTALNGNGGTVTLTPGTGGIQVIQSSSAASDVALVSSGFTIPPAPLSLSLNFAPAVGAPITVVNNTATPAASNPINGTFTNLPQGGVISASYAGQTYSFTANYASGDGNDLVLTDITAATATTIAAPSPSVYGQSVTFTATVTAGTNLVTSGTVNFSEGGTILASGVAINGAGQASFSIATLSASASPHTIVAVYNGTSLYLTSSGSANQTVTPAPLTITADDQSKVYGAADPTLTYTPSGTLYNGDTYSVISGVSLSTATGSAATAGTHTITATGGTAANYSITDANGTLTVSQAPLTVTADNQSKVYGGIDPSLTYTPSGTLYYTDSYSVISGVVLSTATSAAATVGTHTITATGGTAANYAITDANGTLTVSPAPLTVTADDENKIYGGTDPTLTYTASGTLCYGDQYSVISGVTLATATGSAATAGTHVITATGGTAANYTITDVPGTLTVSPASLTVTADNQSKVYGGIDPTLTYTASGTLYYGDQYSVISGVTLATAAGAAATAGTHTITAIGGTAANYAITDADGTLTVSPASLTVTADNQSKVYGGTDPTLTYTASGTLYYTDSYSVISGVTLSTATGSAATAGTHFITATGGTAANYSITDVPGTLSVAQATPVVDVCDAGGICNESAFPATATAVGISGIPTASLEGVSPTLTYYVGSTISGSGSSTAPSAVGTYTVVANFPGSADYTAAQSTPVTFTITSQLATSGLYDPTSSWWYLRNSNATGGASITAGYGPPGGNWIPLSGDWTGNGKDTIGLYNPATGFFYLRNSNTTGVGDITFFYGDPSQHWIPVVGDWTGQKSSAGYPIDSVGMYDPKTCTWYLRNSLTTGVADITIGYGPPAAGWLPLVGDWDGNGTTTVGLYAPATGYFYLRNSNTTGVGNIAFFYGDPTQNWTPVAGDWTGDGHDSIGMYDPKTCTWYLRNELSTGVADMTFGFGSPGSGWLPVIGDWSGATNAPALTTNGLLGSATASAPLSQTELQPIVALAGLGSTVLAPMTPANYVASNLAGEEPGQAGENTANAEQNTAGKGSSIDPTAATDVEFTRLGSGAQLQTVDPLAADYVAGAGDVYSSATRLMSGMLPTGVPRLPGATEIDAILAEPGAQ
jgi:sugar lactone lactonase YvrE